MLGDSLQDAINVCVKNLGDVQLAITLARIKEGKDDGPVLQKLIRERVLPMALESQDRYLAHWCLWMMGRQARALEVLVVSVAGRQTIWSSTLIFKTPYLPRPVTETHHGCPRKRIPLFSSCSNFPQHNVSTRRSYSCYHLPSRTIKATTIVSVNRSTARMAIPLAYKQDAPTNWMSRVWLESAQSVAIRQPHR